MKVRHKYAPRFMFKIVCFGDDPSVQAMRESLGFYTFLLGCRHSAAVGGVAYCLNMHFKYRVSTFADFFKIKDTRQKKDALIK